MPEQRKRKLTTLRKVQPKSIIAAYLTPGLAKRQDEPDERQLERQVKTVEDSIRLTLIYLAHCDPPFPNGMLVSDEKDHDTVVWTIPTETLRSHRIEMSATPEGRPTGRSVSVYIGSEFFFDADGNLLKRDFHREDGKDLKPSPRRRISSESLDPNISGLLKKKLAVMRSELAQAEFVTHQMSRPSLVR